MNEKESNSGAIIVFVFIFPPFFCIDALPGDRAIDSLSDVQKWLKLWGQYAHQRGIVNCEGGVGVPYDYTQSLQTPHPSPLPQGERELGKD